MNFFPNSLASSTKRYFIQVSHSYEDGQASKLQKRKIKDVGKKMYIDVKQKIALAVETDKENMALRQRISELDERAVAREKSRADAAERKAQEQTLRGDREEKRGRGANHRSRHHCPMSA